MCATVFKGIVKIVQFFLNNIFFLYIVKLCNLSRSTDELFQLLEDNQVTLSTMKASRHAKPFEKEVDLWECTLSHILEVIEMILQVQRQWMYLEVCMYICIYSLSWEVCMYICM